MKDIEVKMNGFRIKKLLALTACACMALGVVSLPVQAEGEGDKGTSYAYTSDANGYGYSEDEEALVDFMREPIELEGVEYEKANFIFFTVSSIVESNLRNNVTDAETLTKLRGKIEEARVFMEAQNIYLSYNGYNIEIMKKYTTYMNNITQVIGVTFTYDDVNNSITVINKDGSSYTNQQWDQRKQPMYAATSDPKNPSKLIDTIKNTDRPSVTIPVEKGSESLSKGIFEAAKAANKKIEVNLYDEKGKSFADFSFEEGITNPVEVNFGMKMIENEGIVKGLEKAVAFDFAHSGALPGPMTVTVYVEAYKDIKEETTMFLYLLDEKTGELVKQEQPATVRYGRVKFTIDHCSAYVTTFEELTTEEVKVADPVVTPEAPETTTPEAPAKETTTPEAPAKETPATDKDENIVKDGGIQHDATVGFKVIALLALCGAAVYSVTRKEKA